MPTYDYECSKCKYVFDIYQSFSEDKLKKCPQCNKKSLERLIGVGIHCHVENVTTIGQLGERNAKKAGKCKMEERNGEYSKAKSEQVQVRKEHKEINAIKNKRKYIETGIKE